MEKDKNLNIEKSLDLKKNEKAIRFSSNENDGGKSGELFFFSYDSKLVLKTINL